MAGWLRKLVVCICVAACPFLIAARNAIADGPGYAADLITTSSGNQSWAYYSYSSESKYDSNSGNLPTRHYTQQCIYSNWELYKLNTATQDREYGVYVYDWCANDKQIYPGNQRPCRNDDGHSDTAGPSFCVTLGPGTLPVGLSTPECNALAVVSVSLHADITPAQYDPTQPPPMTATTSFADDFQQRLSEATCTDVLNWNVLSWTFKWTDGTVNHHGPSGIGGTTDIHTLAATTGTGESDTASVTAIAHIHITGTAWDWGVDNSGSVVPIKVARDTYVDVSNDAGADGSTAPVYTPPVLQAGAIGIGQSGNGTIPALDKTLPVSAHFSAIEGRLLEIYPRPIILQPGTESVGGVLIGTAQSFITSWRYEGSYTDAPSREATAPGSVGTSLAPIAVQYNHAERLGPGGQLIDEQVPVTLTVRTVYPDGTTQDSSISGQIAITIYYVGLNYEG